MAAYFNGGLMKAVIQRVMNASVQVDGKVVGAIDQGILIYLGIIQGDTKKQAEDLAEKIVRFRIFPDHQGKMNLSLLEVQGKALIVSQFTLAADGKKGNRPSFDLAALPDQAIPLYEQFIQKIRSFNIHAETGIFGAHMNVIATNHGPVTFCLEK